MGERAQAARNRALSQAPKREAVPTPFWPDDEGFVFLEDVPADEVTAPNMKYLTEAGQPDTAKAGAALLCKALVIKEADGTYSHMFNFPDDVSTVAHLGMSVLMPVTNQANVFFGFTPKAVEQAKNDSEPTQNSSSGIGSATVREASIVP
jgi:hypothetical protein